MAIHSFGRSHCRPVTLPASHSTRPVTLSASHSVGQSLCWTSKPLASHSVGHSLCRPGSQSHCRPVTVGKSPSQPVTLSAKSLCRQGNLSFSHSVWLVILSALSLCRPVTLSASQPVGQSHYRPVTPSASHFLSQSLCPPDTLSASHSAGQSLCWPITLSAKSICRLVTPVG